MDPEAPKWMAPTIEAVQPWCDEPVVAAGPFRAGGWVSGMGRGLIEALAGTLLRRTPKHVSERSGGLPDTVILALGRTKVFVLPYARKWLRLDVGAPVRVWSRDDLMVDTDARRAAGKLTIDVLSTGDHHELESTSMTGRAGLITKGIFSMLENTDFDPPPEEPVPNSERLRTRAPYRHAGPPSKKALAKRKRMEEIADEIEAEMQRLGWWQADPPSEGTAIAGGAFGRETIAFTQWLQVIFVNRLRQAAAGTFEIPKFSQVSTMAHRELDGGPEDIDRLMDLLREVDRLVGA